MAAFVSFSWAHAPFGKTPFCRVFVMRCNLHFGTVLVSFHSFIQLELIFGDNVEIKIVCVYLCFTACCRNFSTVEWQEEFAETC